MLYAAAFVLLLLMTRNLWLGWGEFPQTPAAGSLISIPRSVDAGLAVGAAVGLIVAAVARRWAWFWTAASTYVLLSFCLNQHRMQVWAWHLCVAGLLTVFSAPGRAVPRLRWLTISIYTWSAVSKLDTSFVDGPGRTLLGGLASALGMNLPAGAFGQSGPWLMPMGELATAVALAVPAFRRIGLWLSIIMHVVLLLAVGPLGLRHEAGVQIWNGLFLVQNVLLFGRSSSASVAIVDANVAPASSRFDRAMRGLLGFVVVMPALQPWGYWDVWPSWAVYSARGGWTTSYVHHDDIGNLPPDARPFVGEPAPLSDWHPVDVDAWSLSALRCPVYPQARFRLSVAAALSRTARIQVERRSAPDRFTGMTRIETFEVADGTLPEQVADEFWLNTVPRRPSGN